MFERISVLTTAKMRQNKEITGSTNTWRLVGIIMATTVVSDFPRCTGRTKETDQVELEVKVRGKKGRRYRKGTQNLLFKIPAIAKYDKKSSKSKLNHNYDSAEIISYQQDTKFDTKTQKL